VRRELHEEVKEEQAEWGHGMAFEEWLSWNLARWRDRCEELRGRLAAETAKCIYGGYLEEIPVFVQGDEKMPDVADLLTAQEVNHMVEKFSKAERLLEQYREAVGRHNYDLHKAGKVDQMIVVEE
jgi:hypothetical protein